MHTRKIVVDLNPGTHNGPAIARARALAEASGATVDLFVCDHLQWLAGDLVFTAQNVDGTREQYFAELADWAAELGKPLQADGIEVSVHTAWHTPKYEAVLEHANKAGADWIVRAASRRGALERLLLTATDWELIRQAQQHLWLVKSSNATVADQRVLVAVDPTHPQDPEMNRDRRLLDTSLALCEELGAELHVFHAWAAPMAAAPVPAGVASADAAAVPIPRLDEEALQGARERHRQRLDSLLADYDISRERVHMSEGSAADAIGGVIEEHGIDVVVAGAVSRSWLQRMLIGSTAERLFDAVACDLIVVKEKALPDDK